MNRARWVVRETQLPPEFFAAATPASCGGLGGKQLITAIHPGCYESPREIICQHPNLNLNAARQRRSRHSRLGSCSGFPWAASLRWVGLPARARERWAAAALSLAPWRSGRESESQNEACDAALTPWPGTPSRQHSDSMPEHPQAPSCLPGSVTVPALDRPEPARLSGAPSGRLEPRRGRTEALPRLGAGEPRHHGRRTPAVRRAGGGRGGRCPSHAVITVRRDTWQPPTGKEMTAQQHPVARR